MKKKYFTSKLKAKIFHESRNKVNRLISNDVPLLEEEEITFLLGLESSSPIVVNYYFNHKHETNNKSHQIHDAMQFNYSTTRQISINPTKPPSPSQ